MPIDRVLPTSPYQASWMQAIAEGHRIWQSQRLLPQSDTTERIFAS